MQTIVLQSPEMAYEVLSGSGDVKHPDSSKSPNCSPVTLRSPYLRVCWFLGMKKEFLMGPNVGVYKGELFFFFFIRSCLMFKSCIYFVKPIARQPRVLTKYFWAFRTAACAAQGRFHYSVLLSPLSSLPIPYSQTGALL